MLNDVGLCSGVTSLPILKRKDTEALTSATRSRTFIHVLYLPPDRLLPKKLSGLTAK